MASGGWATAGGVATRGWRKVRAPREYGAGQRPAGVKPQGKCHRKQTAAAWKHPAARVKGWGKSPPHPRQRGWHGKPHREQGRIGVAGSAARGSPRSADAGAFPPRRPGWPREACGDTGSRGMVVHCPRAGTEPGLQAIRHHFSPLSAGRTRLAKEQIANAYNVYCIAFFFSRAGGELVAIVL